MKPIHLWVVNMILKMNEVTAILRIYVCVLMTCIVFIPSAFAVTGPVVVNDENFGPEGIVLTGNLGENDFDPDGGTLTFSVVNPPSSGSFVLLPNGEYTYTPEPEFNGFQFITYRACDDEGLCATAILEIAMLFVNDLPTIVDDNFFVTQNTTLNNSVASNDFDIDIEPIFYTVFTPPAVGTVSLNYTTGQFSYTPPNGFLGTVTWQYYGCDPCGVCDVGLVTITIIEQNGIPVANDDELYGAEDEPLIGNLSVNDSDPDGNPLSFHVVDEPLNGQVTIDANGVAIYNPDPEFNGFDEFTYSACDPFGDCDFALVSVYVSSVNDSPVGVADVFNASEDQVVTGNVGTNDFDVDIEVLFYIASSGTTNGIFTLSNNGNFTFVPNPNFFGVANAYYWVIDPCGFSSELTTVTFNISPVNDLPIAVSDQFSGPENESITGSVALNDSDIETSASGLMYQVVTPPVNGTLSLQMNGSFVYTPNLNYFGVENITYRVIDANGGFANAQLVIEITSVNSIPTVQDETFTIDEDEVLTQNVSTNDVPEPGEVLTYSVANAPLNGSLILSPSGAFVYTPNPNFFGTEIIGYIATDPFGASDFGQLTIIVNSVDDPPVAVNDEVSGLEDNIITGNVGTNDSDVENDDLIWLVVDAPVTGTFNLSESTGSFTYTPEVNFNGAVEIVYAVVDEEGAQGFGILTINVLPVNDAPLAAPDFFETHEDTGISGSVGDNDFDVDGDVLSYTLLSQPVHGVIQWSNDGVFSYSPNPNFVGTEALSYTANDDVFNSGSTAFVIQVLPVNDVPIAVNDFFLTLENQTVSGTLSTNDSDVDGDVLQYTVLVAPAWGTLELNSNGNFVYTPATNFFGIVQATYQVSDGNGGVASAILSIAVQSVNSVPVAQNDMFVSAEDQSLSASVALNDSDVENDALNYTLVQGVAQGALTLQSNGTFTYIPVLNFNGVVSFIYSVSDGADSDTAMVTITISPVNDIPVIGADTFSLLEDEELIGNLAINDSDVETNPMNYTLVTTPVSGTFLLNSDGTFVYTTEANFFGMIYIEYEYTDGDGATGTAQVTIEVLAVNDQPVANNASYTTEEDQSVSGSLADWVTDVEDDALQFVITTNPFRGVLAMQSNGAFVYTPDPNYSGTDTFSYSVLDGNGGQSHAVVTIVLTSVNDAPVVGDELLSVLMNGDGMIDVAANDIDVDDGDVLTYALMNPPMHGLGVITSDGVLSYTPNENYAGTDAFTYLVCDGDGACAEGEVSILVVENNQVPELQNDQIEFSEDDMVSVDLSSNDSDAEGQPLVYTLQDNGGLNGAVLESSGLLFITPPPHWYGEYTLSYQACDPFGACATATVAVTITAINDEPIVSNGETSMEEDGVLEFDLAPFASDIEDGALIFDLIAPPLHGSAILTVSGELWYTPAANWHGLEEVHFEACDAEGACTAGILQVQVFSVNDVPLVTGESYSLISGNSLTGDVSANDTDVDGEDLVYSLVAAPAFGVLTLSADGTFIFSTSEADEGETTAVYEACDGEVCTPGELVFSVAPFNHPPVAQNATYQACEGDLVSIPLLGLISDQDENSASLTLSALGGVGGFLSFIDATKTVVLELQDGFEGDALVSYTVCDSGSPSLCATGIITVEVQAATSPVILDIVITEVACFGEATGSVQVAGIGENLTYSLSGSFSDGTWEDLAAGTYFLTIASTSLCSVPVTETLVVAGPNEPLTIGDIQVLYDDPEIYAVTAAYEVNGGTAPYTYRWTDGNGETVGNNAQLQVNDSGIFVLEVTDANGCSASVTVSVNTRVEELDQRLAIAVYPNPTQDEIQVSLSVIFPVSIHLELIDATGRLVRERSLGTYSGEWNGTLNLRDTPSGVYFLRVRTPERTWSERIIKL